MRTRRAFLSMFAAAPLAVLPTSAAPKSKMREFAISPLCTCGFMMRNSWRLKPTEAGFKVVARRPADTVVVCCNEKCPEYMKRYIQPTVRAEMVQAGGIE